MQLTERRYKQLSTMDDDLYDQEMHDGRITRSENAACVRQLAEDASRIENNVARLHREATERQEVERRLIDQYRIQALDARMECSSLEDDIRHARAETEERLIDEGVKAARRGEDPIAHMSDLRERAAFFAEAVRQGYFTKDGRTTVKGRKLMVRVRAILAD